MIAESLWSPVHNQVFGMFIGQMLIDLKINKQTKKHPNQALIGYLDL